jgi:hypothetical protein
MGTNIRNWDKKYHGLAVGIPVSQYGLSAFVFTIIAKAFFYGSDKVLDVTSLLILLAVVTSSTNILAAFGLRDCRDLDEEIDVEEDRILQEPLLANDSADTESFEEELNVSCFRYTEAYGLAFILFTIGGCGLMYINNIGNIILALSKGGAGSANIQALQQYHVAAISVASFIGRFSLGLFSDLGSRVCKIDRGTLCHSNTRSLLDRRFCMFNVLWIPSRFTSPRIRVSRLGRSTRCCVVLCRIETRELYGWV